MSRVAFVCAVLLATAAVAEEPAWPFAEIAEAPDGPPASKLEMDAALRYLEANAGSSAAPRVAFDVLIAATLAGNKATADDMRTRLALDYCGSAQGRFALATSDPKEFRELLKKAADKQPMSRSFAESFLPAVKTGTKRWNMKFLTDQEFLLHCVLASRLTGDKELFGICKSQLARKSEGETATQTKLRRTAEILFDGSVSDAETSLRFHAIEHPAAARLAEYFDAQVPETDRSTAELMEARIERSLEARKFADAGPAIEELIAQHGEAAKRLFWLGLCQAAAGDVTALPTLQKVVDRFSGTPWTAPATAAATAFAEYDRIVADHATAAAAVVRQVFAAKVERIELRGEWRKKGVAPVAAYGYVDLSARTVEVSIRRADQWLTAVRFAGDRTRVLVDGDATVHEFPGGTLPIQLPEPALSFDPAAQKFGIRFGDRSLGAVADDAAGAAVETSNALAVLREMKPEYVRPLFERFRSNGTLPMAVVQEGDVRRYSSVSFGVRNPDTRVQTVTIDSENRIIAVEGPEFLLSDLKYGPAGSFEPSPPTWPDRPVARHEKFDPAVMFQLMAAVSKLWSEEPVATAETSGDDQR